MWGAIWAAIKAGATALVWWKQNSDQGTGRKLEDLDGKTQVINEVQEIHDARVDPDNMRSVRDRSARD